MRRWINRLMACSAVGFTALFISACTSATTDALSFAVPAPSLPPGGVSLISELDGGLVKQAGGGLLSEQDRLIALSAEYRALEYTAPAQPVFWQSADGRLTGTVTPSQPYRVGSQDCRQYSLILVGDGPAQQTAAGTACRNTDGSWSLIS
ncbi:MAG: hypothetical protein AAGI92_06610 [Pseudomonadota bacterium]